MKNYTVSFNGKRIKVPAEINGQPVDVGAALRFYYRGMARPDRAAPQLGNVLSPGGSYYGRSSPVPDELHASAMVDDYAHGIPTRVVSGKPVNEPEADYIYNFDYRPDFMPRGPVNSTYGNRVPVNRTGQHQQSKYGWPQDFPMPPDLPWERLPVGMPTQLPLPSAPTAVARSGGLLAALREPLSPLRSGLGVAGNGPRRSGKRSRKD